MWVLGLRPLGLFPVAPSRNNAWSHPDNLLVFLYLDFGFILLDSPFECSNRESAYWTVPLIQIFVLIFRELLVSSRGRRGRSQKVKARCVE